MACEDKALVLTEPKAARWSDHQKVARSVELSRGRLPVWRDRPERWNVAQGGQLTPIIGLDFFSPWRGLPRFDALVEKSLRWQVSRLAFADDVFD
jgi:hypothetical protein